MFWMDFENVWSDFRTCLGHVWGNFWTCFWQCVGHVLDMFGTCFGYVLDIFWTSFGHVLEKCWVKRWTIFRPCLGHIPDRCFAEVLLNYFRQPYRYCLRGFRFNKAIRFSPEAFCMHIIPQPAKAKKDFYIFLWGFMVLQIHFP